MELFRKERRGNRYLVIFDLALESTYEIIEIRHRVDGNDGIAPAKRCLLL